MALRHPARYHRERCVVPSRKGADCRPAIVCGARIQRRARRWLCQISAGLLGWHKLGQRRKLHLDALQRSGADAVQTCSLLASMGRLLILLPCALARSSPDLTRSWIIGRSNSAKTHVGVRSMTSVTTAPEDEAVQRFRDCKRRRPKLGLSRGELESDSGDITLSTGQGLPRRARLHCQR